MKPEEKYKFEVYHKNSFDVEQRKARIKKFVFASALICLFCFLFIRACYLERKSFEDPLQVIINKKEKAVRNEIKLQVYDIDTSKKYSLYFKNKKVDKLALFDKIHINDSLAKDSFSNSKRVFRKENGKYMYVFSF